VSFQVARIGESTDASSGGPASPLMAHTVTLYNALGEVDRRATYARTVLAGVRVEAKSGAVASMAGSTSTDGLLVFIPGAIGGYVEPEVYVGQGWTLREGDLLVVGECTSDIPPVAVTQLEATREVYRIKGFETLRLRDEHVHHWEVAGA
jgi:hypothetical protein